MAANNPVFGNECGLPLNAVAWLEMHHRCKAAEREQMVRDLQLKAGSLVVDAGCGPGLWVPLLAQAIGPQGRIIGVDISVEALVTARRRSAGTWYAPQVEYKLAPLEQLPLAHGSVDAIFSANVSQYLPEPVKTFKMLGQYLAPGGRLIVKDIDFGTLRFHTIDPGLQARVFQARERWERIRVEHGYPFEDSWVGSKLAGYLREAGYEEIEEKTYLIQRRFPLTPDYRTYLQGIAEWFVCEGAPGLSSEDLTAWLQCFFDEEYNVFDQETFLYEETEYVVSGVWPGRRLSLEEEAQVAASAEPVRRLLSLEEARP